MTATVKGGAAWGISPAVDPRDLGSGVSTTTRPATPGLLTLSTEAGTWPRDGILTGSCPTGFRWGSHRPVVPAADRLRGRPVCCWVKMNLHMSAGIGKPIVRLEPVVEVAVADDDDPGFDQRSEQPVGQVRAAERGRASVGPGVGKQPVPPLP